MGKGLAELPTPRMVQLLAPIYCEGFDGLTEVTDSRWWPSPTHRPDRVLGVPTKVSGFEQTRPEKVITLGWIGIPDWKLLGKLSPTRESKMEILADVGGFFSIVSSEI
jgi:hypothetical protein